MRRSFAALFFVLALLLTGCGGAAAPADKPESPETQVTPRAPADSKAVSPDGPESGGTADATFEEPDGQDTAFAGRTAEPALPEAPEGPESAGNGGVEDTPDVPDTVNPPDKPGRTDLPDTSGTDGGEAKPKDRDSDNGGAAALTGKISGARPSNAGKLAVRGTSLVSESGETVQLRGISTHGLAWFPQYVNEELFSELSRDWGVNAVRLAMYTAEYGGYCTGGDKAVLRQIVYDGVKYAAGSDMYAIVDWHILSDGDPNTYKSEALSFFQTVSAELSGYDNVIYEICNEPNGGTDWTQVKSYAQDIIAAIRENDDAVILVGTPNWCQYLDKAAADPITGYDNIMYTLHFYAATHGASLRKTMTEAIDAGLPVFVSEFGICDASGNGAINEAEADLWAAEMDRYSVSWMMWSLSNKAESASAISSSCDKTSGFSLSDLTQSGRWLLNKLSGTLPDGPETTEDAAAITEPGDPDMSTNPPDSQIQPGLPGPSVEEPDGDTGETGEVEWQLEMVNTWQGGDGEYRQYTLTVVNPGDDISIWSVTFELDASFTITNSWNGNFSASGNTLTVTPMDYNAVIPAGGTVSDIGFIVRM